jgi:hypothetical protein
MLRDSDFKNRQKNRGLEETAMATNTYIGPAGKPPRNNWWSNKDNWSGDSPQSSPSTGDAVVLPAARTGYNGAGYTVLLNVNSAALGSLTIDSPSSGLTELQMEGYTLTISGVLSMNANTEIAGYGAISAGALAISGGTATFAATNGATSLAIDAGSTTFNSANSILDASTVSIAEVNLANSGAISGFIGSDEIKVEGFSTGDSFTVTGYNLKITGAGHTQTYTFASGTAMSNISVSESSGVDIITICFMAGTLIRTPEGEVPVETIMRGDLVLTTEGLAKAVTWMGRQTVSRRFADPVRSWPVRVKAGALGGDSPRRDLLVSPDHALLVEGVLIHAGALVNGTSIVRETIIPEVFVYYHVELDDHSLILAENAPAETFVDNIDRLNFDNWAEHEALYPDGKSVEELGYPRAKSRRQVPAEIRGALNHRAEELGLLEQDAAVA